MSTRQEFLSRVQAALGRRPGEPVPDRRENSSFGTLDGVMQPIADEQVIDKFEIELQKVSGCTYRAGSAAELDDILLRLLRECQAKAAVLTRNPILAAAKLPEKLAAWGVEAMTWPESGEEQGSKSFREKAFNAEVGISGVEFVLAESGTLVLTSRSEGTQLGSLAPPVHIALYRCNQALASLDEVLERLAMPLDPAAPQPGRSIVFITGPSRTADIEQVLIRGVHGPKEVHAILVEDACLVAER